MELTIEELTLRTRVLRTSSNGRSLAVRVRIERDHVGVDGAAGRLGERPLAHDSTGNWIDRARLVRRAGVVGVTRIRLLLGFGLRGATDRDDFAGHRRLPLRRLNGRGNWGGGGFVLRRRECRNAGRAAGRGVGARGRFGGGRRDFGLRFGVLQDQRLGPCIVAQPPLSVGRELDFVHRGGRLLDDGGEVAGRRRRQIKRRKRKRNSLVVHERLERGFARTDGALPRGPRGIHQDVVVDIEALNVSARGRPSGHLDLRSN